MKVLRPGKKPEDKVAEFTCPRCDAVVLAAMNEGIRKSRDQRDGDYVEFVCPECNFIITVSAKKFA
jgi:RNase P subunit RPR2